MYSFKSTEALKLVHKVQQVRDFAADEKEKLASAHPSWDVIRDARLTSFAKIINVLHSTQLALTFIGQNLLDPMWWASTSKTAIPHTDANIYIREFDMFAKMGCVQFVFLSIESGFRILLRSIDSGACNGGTAEFKSVYECLLKTKLTSTPTYSVELLDLLRYVRNTVHNNGVYYHKDGNDASVVYKGTTYNFLFSKPVDFVTWEFVLSLTEDVVKLLREVDCDSSVESISSTLVDHFV